MINLSLYFCQHFFFPKEIFSARPVKFLYLCRACPVKPCFTRVIPIPLCHSRLSACTAQAGESGNLSSFCHCEGALATEAISSCILFFLIGQLVNRSINLYSILDTIYCFHYSLTTNLTGRLNLTT